MTWLRALPLVFLVPACSDSNGNDANDAPEVTSVDLGTSGPYVVGTTRLELPAETPSGVVTVAGRSR